eukprot:TRINITY_DN19786_c0_g1_i1.p1 TRINITY_DN19786_c0_g1~~TRINITY_DN19786_c0_g1_i1.p1  ORF type:complete len:176 (-),score=25.24 TRINITY_DN19786_c0_g1_i1:167-694(-)
MFFFFFFQAEDGIRDAQESRGLGDVYKRQLLTSTKRGSKFGSVQRESMSCDRCSDVPSKTRGRVLHVVSLLLRVLVRISNLTPCAVLCTLYSPPSASSWQCCRTVLMCRSAQSRCENSAGVLWLNTVVRSVPASKMASTPPPSTLPPSSNRSAILVSSSLSSAHPPPPDLSLIHI